MSTLSLLYTEQSILKETNYMPANTEKKYKN